MFRDWLPKELCLEPHSLYDPQDKVYRTRAYSMTRNPRDSGVTILVLDDRICDCFREVDYQRGEDQHIIRTVVNRLALNELVREVIAADFDREILNLLYTTTNNTVDLQSIAGRRKIDFSAGRLYVLLDIYGQANASFGHEYFNYLNRDSPWELHSSRIFAFSTGDSNYLHEKGVRNGIDKPTGRGNDDSYEKLTRETDEFVLRIANSHHSVFKRVCTPSGEKTSIGKLEDVFLIVAKQVRENCHASGNCHSVQHYIQNVALCNESISETWNCEATTVLKSSLAETIGPVANELFRPIETVFGEESIEKINKAYSNLSAFVISKSISCYGTDANGEPDCRLPGYWLAVLTKMKSPGEIGAYCFHLHPGQPLVGLLHAIKHLVFDDKYIDTQTSVLNDDIQLEVKMLISNNGSPPPGLEGLRETLQKMFVEKARPEHAEGRGLTTAAFQTLMDSGFLLRCADLIDNKLKIKLRVDLRKCE